MSAAASGVWELPPGVIRSCRELYERSNTSLQTLADDFGANVATLQDISKRQRWRRYETEAIEAAEAAEAEIMVDRLKPRRKSSIRVVDPNQPRKAGRPPRDPNSPISKALRRARAMYAPGANLADMARKLGVSRHTLYRARNQERWDEALGLNDQEAPQQRSLIRPYEPLSEDRKTELRIALAAIRAAMSVEQVQLIEKYEATLSKYGSLIEMYLDPLSHVPDADRLQFEQRLERAAVIRADAGKTLFPGDSDTLAGSVKVLCETAVKFVDLKRKVAGLDKVAVGKLPPGIEPVDPAQADQYLAGGPQLLDVESLSTDDLRAVQHGMALLTRYQQGSRELPMPPPPAPIDDLLGPEAQVKEPFGAR